MRKIVFLLMVFWSCTSCNSNSSKTDSDPVPDKDVIVADSDANDSAPDESGDADTILPDPDSVTDTDLNDSEFIDDCDIKLIDAKFPYYDKDNNITFCRPGCDTPTEKDPQCMSNLWREQNYNLCHQHPEYDCCGSPCILESLKPVTKEEEEEIYKENATVMHKCDLKINPRFWSHDGTHGIVKSWNMSEGKIGFKISPIALSIEEWPVKMKYVAYEIATKKFNFILPARGQEQAYYKGSRIALLSDKRSLELNNSNIFLAYIGDDGLSTLAYNKKVHRMAYEPALNDKWAFVNLQEADNSPYKMMYAKVDDPSSNSTADSWKWTELGEGLGASPAMSGNNLSVTDENYFSYICDLSKNPKSFEDCFKMNEGDEKISFLYFDKENGNRMVFSQKLNNNFKIILAEKEGNTYKRTDLITDFTDATSKYAYSIIPKTLRGNVLLYEEVAVVDGEGSGLLCYYRIDKKRKYCMKKMEKDETTEDGTVIYPYGFAEYEGKWLLYQKRSSTPLILRDMDCYCKEEGVCPFEE